jgi:ATP-dependent helicase HrpB
LIVAVAVEEHGGGVPRGGMASGGSARGGSARGGSKAGASTQHRQRALVRWASAIEPEWLLDHFPQLLSEREQLSFNAQTQRVERTAQLLLGSIVLDESRHPATPSGETSEVLAKAVLSKGTAELDPEDDLDQLLRRLALLAQHRPDAFDGVTLPSTREEAIQLACEGLVSFSELSSVGLSHALSARLPGTTQELIRRELPEQVQLEGGRRVRVHYEVDRPPWIESRLQDFFSMTRTPTILGGRQVLAVHLLAPNQRAVQVTQDLAGFWEKHYPGIRKELRRRYPRHLWPEDGATARPPTPGRIR